ncbi:hypothetical protein JCM17823_11080 [Halorubrum gandharaense]
MSIQDTNLSRRTVLKSSGIALGAGLAGGGAALFGSSPALAADVEDDDLTVELEANHVTSVTVAPEIEVSWFNLEELSQFEVDIHATVDPIEERDHVDDENIDADLTDNFQSSDNNWEHMPIDPDDDVTEELLSEEYGKDSVEDDDSEQGTIDVGELGFLDGDHGDLGELSIGDGEGEGNVEEDGPFSPALFPQDIGDSEWAVTRVILEITVEAHSEDDELDTVEFDDIEYQVVIIPSEDGGVDGDAVTLNTDAEGYNT